MEEEGVDRARYSAGPPRPPNTGPTRPPRPASAAPSAEGMSGMDGLLQGRSLADSAGQRSANLGALVGSLEVHRDVLAESERRLTARVAQLERRRRIF